MVRDVYQEQLKMIFKQSQYPSGKGKNGIQTPIKGYIFLKVSNEYQLCENGAEISYKTREKVHTVTTYNPEFYPLRKCLRSEYPKMPHKHLQSKKDEKRDYEKGVLIHIQKIEYKIQVKMVKILSPKYFSLWKRAILLAGL